MKKNFDEYFNETISTCAFSTPSGGGGSPVGEITPSNFVGTQGKGKKKVQKRPIPKFPQGDKSGDVIPNGQRTVGSAVNEAIERGKTKFKVIKVRTKK